VAVYHAQELRQRSRIASASLTCLALESADGTRRNNALRVTTLPLTGCL
jgi:hypothetical protein